MPLDCRHLLWPPVQPPSLQEFSSRCRGLPPVAGASLAQRRADDCISPPTPCLAPPLAAWPTHSSNTPSTPCLAPPLAAWSTHSSNTHPTPCLAPPLAA